MRNALSLLPIVAAALLPLACGGGGSGNTGGGGGTSSSSSSGTGGASSSSSSSSASSSSSTGSSSSGGPATGPFTSTGSSSYEAQTSLAADAQGHAVAVWIAFFADNTSAIGESYSADGGASWTAPQYVYAPGGRLSSNPVVAADGQGQFYLAWLGFRADSLNPDEHVYLAKMTSPGVFGAPVVASDDGTATSRDFDKPSIAIDANDNILLSWADFTGSGMGTPASLTFARSTDGATFTRATVTADSTFGNLASLCLDVSAGPAAPIYMVHLGAGATVTLRKSVDQGKTWAIKSVPAASVVFQDPTCVAHGNDLFVAYASGTAVFSPSQDSPGDAVQVTHSGDGGDSFSAPVTVSNGAAGTQYLFPRLGRDASTGKLAMVYYQGKVGEAAAFELATSDTGASWAPAMFDSAGTFTVDRTLASWLGGYVGFAPGAAGPLATFTENTMGKAHIRFKGSP